MQSNTSISADEYYQKFKQLNETKLRKTVTEETKKLNNREIIVQPFNIHVIRNKLRFAEMKLAQITDLIVEVNEDIKNLPRRPSSEK